MGTRSFFLFDTADRGHAYLARSLPVPSGMMAMGGHGRGKLRLSRVCSTQPTVPSPPHTEIRAWINFDSERQFGAEDNTVIVGKSVAFR